MGLLHEDVNSKALGNIHSLTSPYFETEFYPEAYILKAVIYFKRCNYDRSQEAINEFNAIYPDLRKEVDGILAKYPDNAQFYDYILKIKSGEAGLSERAQNAAAGASQDRSLLKNIEWVNELDRELKAIDKADPAWKSTAVAGNILQDLTLQKSLAANDAGQLARIASDASVVGDSGPDEAGRSRSKSKRSTASRERSPPASPASSRRRSIRTRRTTTPS